MKHLLPIFLCLFLAPLGAQTTCTILPEPDGAGRGIGTADRDLYWPGGIIPYINVIPDETTEQLLLRNRLTAAIEQINRQTNVCFIPRQEERGFVRIQTSSWGNYASLGYENRQRLMGLHVIGANHLVCLHEICHILGIYHEHQRPDRDEYLLLFEENIDPEFLYNFDLQPFDDSALHTPYDLNSIMHYPPWAFASNAAPAFEYLDSLYEYRRPSDISPYDLQQINAMYPVNAGNCDSIIAVRAFEVEMRRLSEVPDGGFCANRPVNFVAESLQEEVLTPRYAWTAENGIPATGNSREFSTSFTGTGPRADASYVS